MCDWSRYVTKCTQLQSRIKYLDRLGAQLSLFTMKPTSKPSQSKLEDSLRETLRSATSIAHRRVLDDTQNIPMSAYYEMLRNMVPCIPTGRQLSRVEILEYVIDYIQDLQNALESQSSLRTVLPPTNRSTRRPLTSISLNKTLDKVRTSQSKGLL